MRLFKALTLVAALAATPVDANPEAVRDTIRSQIDAFLADDIDTAFTFASPKIQGIFGTPENFGAMVRGGYPMVWRPADVRFLDLRDEGGFLWQNILVTDGNGQRHVLEYQMIRLESGWKINGVRYLKAASPSV